jgi:hypothetical protein
MKGAWFIVVITSLDDIGVEPMVKSECNVSGATLVNGFKFQSYAWQ